MRNTCINEFVLVLHYLVLVINILNLLLKIRFNGLLIIESSQAPNQHIKKSQLLVRYYKAKN